MVGIWIRDARLAIFSTGTPSLPRRKGSGVVVKPL
jgi:hypothetical protein